MNNNQNMNNIWDLLREEVSNGDIVLELKIFSADIALWNRTMKFLNETYKKNIINYSNILEIDVECELFSTELSNTVEIIIDKLELFLPFYELSEIEFFTGSICNFNDDEIKPLFNFMKKLSYYLGKDIDIFCEGLKVPSVKYLYAQKEFIIP